MLRQARVRADRSPRLPQAQRGLDAVRRHRFLELVEDGDLAIAKGRCADQVAEGQAPPRGLGVGKDVVLGARGSADRQVGVREAGVAGVEPAAKRPLAAPGSSPPARCCSTTRTGSAPCCRQRSRSGHD